MRKKPLYRKVNTRARGVHHDTGGDYRHSRNARQGPRQKMARGKRRGLDYTPLFRFLLSRVGQPWTPTLAEAQARLDREAPIWWLVAGHREDGHDVVCIGERSYYSGLYVDDDDVLRKVAPEIGPETLAPRCSCCTHTFNGVPFTRPFVPPEPAAR
ncbi:MAG: hypothetical protein AAFV53_22650 [Myxococcota bacterium]